MRRETNGKRNSGFTLVEMLAVTAIVVILLAVGMVSVVRYARWLEITELDNTAREIYLAAENRAVLLSAGGRLNKLVAEKGQTLALPAEGAGVSPLAAGGGDQEGELRYISYSYNDAKDALDDLLPEGTIDPALRKGTFYIVYQLNVDEEGNYVGTGSVTDVFYAGKGGNIGELADIYPLRELSREERLNAKKMVGYYGSASVGGGASSPLSAPIVEIQNGEELTVRVKYTAAANGKHQPVLEARLMYGGRTLWLNTEGTGSGWRVPQVDQETSYGETTYTYTWTLDTLKEGGPRFKEIFKDAAPGKDFTVSAKLKQDNITSAEGRAVNNSLFADESNGSTANIANLRHLQNLDQAFSGVAGKTAAVQIADIDQDAGKFEDYQFRPIENSELKSFCGSSGTGEDAAVHTIKGLTVTAESAAGKNGAGLFAAVGEKGEFTFQDVRLINAQVKAGDNVPVGALVGSADNAAFDNCWVYWEMGSQNELREWLTKDGTPVYQIAGGTAGGLAGELNGGTITSCLAATLVRGRVLAGGLVGRADGVTVGQSYADCYLTGPATAGLIGYADGGTSLADVYAAGFIKGTGANARAAGLCAGMVAAERAYSAMRYEDVDSGDIKPLASGVENGKNSCYYLQITSGSGMEFAQMTRPGNSAGTDFARTLGGAFEWKDYAASNPYNLREGMALATYDFPGLAGLPHYGDWNTEFTKPALVYYERYQKDGQEAGYGFYGGGVDCLRDDAVVPLDGYAVAFRAEDLGDELTIWFNGAKDGMTYEKDKLLTVTDTNGQTGEEEIYYLVPLPEKLIDSETAGKDLYQILTFTLSKEGGETASAYCPHFAKTVFPLEGLDTEEQRDGAIAAAAENARISVRTPRHLRALSGFAAYYHPAKELSFTFTQELDLNYANYTGYGWTLENGGKNPEMGKQSPIGRMGQPFRGVYQGGCHTIQGVEFRLEETGSRQYAGLFGLSEGTLKDIVYLMDPDETVTVSRSKVNLYLGGLAGGNNGTIINCAVAGINLEGKVYSKAVGYVGGLVGSNEGTIQNCAAETARLAASGDDYSHAYAGGLVGRNNGAGAAIYSSYAVGRVSAEVSKESDARVCGFVGYNSGLIVNSYAAVQLESSGLGAETYGFAGQKEGQQRNTFFVDKGNFTYRDNAYNASYSFQGDKAEPVFYQDLSGGETPIWISGKPGRDAMALGGAAFNGNPGAKDFPLPTGVVNAEGKPVHYGRWLEPLPLGRMGVYYWEKMELPGVSKDSKRVVYGISMLAVDPNKETVTKTSTLSNARSDGGVVVDYGYGFYIDEDNAVKFTSEGILYTEKGEAGAKPERAESAEDSETNNALGTLMPGYKFHSCRSFVPSPDPGEKGNFVEGTTRPGLYASGTKNSPNGRLTLVEGGVKAVFEINPHFADALSVAEAPKGYTVMGNELKATPGTEKNPYGVRAMGQLSAINWNSENRNTKTVLHGHSNVNKNTNSADFPYLSRVGADTKRYWKQTHDIDGANGTYTPIAEYYDRINGQGPKTSSLFGWFGGEYDGDDYVIQDVKIQGQTSSCAGLFGMIYNGRLDSVILYSSDGTGTVEAKRDEGTLTCWYAAGTLVGMAVTDDKNSNGLVNCSVAGYTVNANVYTSSGWGGSCIGGLAGVSNMALEGCSAVTEVKVPSTAVDNDNMRVGGLVGSCQNSVTNCFAGGSIDIESGVTVPGGKNPPKGVYVGGLVGGSYFKPLRVNGQGVPIGATNDDGGNTANQTDNALTNCYSYVTLPSYEDTVINLSGTNGNKKKLGALYAIGGTGEIYPSAGDRPPGVADSANHGKCTITNCYYLTSEVLKNNKQENGTLNIPGDLHGNGENRLKTDLWELTKNQGEYVPRSDPMGLTYRQLSGKDLIEKGADKRYIMGWLTAFSPVTKTTPGGDSIPGKYSYSSRAKLEGLNYPFPTILTREGGSIHVHYGDWPLEGIERAAGGGPIEVNLLRSDTETETLTLSEGVPEGGEWTVSPNEEDRNKLLAAGEPAPKATVKITGYGEGTCTIEVTGYEQGLDDVTVTYTVGGVEYSVTITVKVTAELRVKPQTLPIYVLPGADVRVPLSLCDENWQELTAERQAAVEIVTEKSVCNPPWMLNWAKLQKDETGGYYLQLKAAEYDEERVQEGAQAMPVNVAYYYGKAAGEGENRTLSVENSTLTVEMLAPPEPELDKETGEVRLTFPAIPLEQDGEGPSIVTTVTEVVVNGVKEPDAAGPVEPPETTEPVETAEPAPEPEVVGVGNVVTLKNYAPGAEVTLELKLELKRSDDGEADAPPVVQVVPMTVTIPKAEPEETKPDHPDAGTQKDGSAAPEAGQAEVREDAVQAAQEPEPALPAKESMDPVPAEPDRDGEEGDGA